MGGKFQGSTDGTNWVDLGTVTSVPPSGTMTSLNLSSVNYRYLRYLSPNGTYGNVAEVEFRDASGALLTGTAIGTAGSYNNGPDTKEKVLDGNFSTFFDGPTGDGVWVGIDRAP